MTGSLAALALAGLLAPWGPAHTGTRAPEPDTLRGPGSTVPYVAQGPLLCGGASAAMVERFWGALGVYAEDYAGLVSREAGGILTGDLANAMRDRGFQVQVLEDDPEAALRQVRGDLPVIALLESGESRYHYVVIVAADGERVRFHDPILRPGRTLSRADFLRRWAPSRYWSLVAVPDPSAVGAAAAGDTTRDDARAVSPDELPATLAAALRDLRAGRTETAEQRVAEYLETTPDSAAHRAIAWQMLASARFLAGRELPALEAWNAIDEPPVDLVRVVGLHALRYRTVADAMGIRPRAVLRPAALRLARRRLLQLPAVQLGRVGYRPLRNGAVELQAALLERRRTPGVPELAVTGVGALINRRAEVGLGPVLPVGERWSLGAAWQEARSRVEGSVAVPWPPLASVVTIRGGWTEERFAPGAADPVGERRWGVATLRRWMTPATRVGVTAGLERWGDGTRIGRIGASGLVSLLEDRLRFGADADGWLRGGRSVGRARAGALARIPASPRREWSLTLAGSLTSAGAPPTLWDGAGTGRIRAPLLRGHPLDRGGVLGADAFGRGLLTGSLGHAWFSPVGPGRASLELFVDGARVWRPLVGTGPRSYLDPGVELSLSMGEQVAAVSLARGGDRWVLSARVGSGPLPFLSTR